MLSAHCYFVKLDQKRRLNQLMFVVQVDGRGGGRVNEGLEVWHSAPGAVWTSIRICYVNAVY